MKRITYLFLMLALCLGYAGAQSADGDWTGKLDVGGHSLKLVLHISSSPVTITMDSPDQGANGIPCEPVFLSADSVNLRIPGLMVNYAGRVQGDTITGIFRQGGMQLPLVFERGLVKRNRPQTPQPPYPYDTTDIKINNEQAGVTLAGTLSVPKDCSATTPLVIFVTGSGLQNRDEEMFEHKPFAVIADYLARNGIASFRYDDRGTGKSTSNSSDEPTTADFASDTKAVLDFFRAQNSFGKIGILGHSEGGIIACMLGARSDGPDFIVSIAGPSVTGAEILDYQNTQALVKNGMPEDKASEYAVAARQRIEADPSMKWMRNFINYNPADDLKSLSIPALLIYGEKDRQVPPSLNLDAARKLTPQATIKLYPGLNHLMQHAASGDVDEYAQIEESISPELLSDIVSFIQSVISQIRQAK